MVAFGAVLVWTGLALAIVVPLAIAAASPLLAWREPLYSAAGFAGVIAMGLILLQPLLAGGYLPGLPTRRGRRIHRWVAGVLVAMVAMHVAGFWLTNAPDVIDALLFNAPTAFSVWGVVAMWATIAAACLAVFRARWRMGVRAWRTGHSALAATVVVASVIHAVLIEGTMGTVSKTVLCVLALAATAKVMLDLRVWQQWTRQKPPRAGPPD